MPADATHQRCPDCAEYPVNHHVEWFSSFVDSVTEPIFTPLGVISQKLWRILGDPSFDRLALPFLRALAFLRLGTIQSKIDELAGKGAAAEIDDLKKKLKVFAAQNSKTMNQVVEEAVREHCVEKSWPAGE